jgi:plasmid stabilization system protein ParE
MKLRYTAPAERELAEIVSYLLNQTPAGAALFVDELERGLSRLLRHPFSAQQTDMPGVRRLSLRRFPYSVFHTGLSHLSFAELGEEACKESLAQGGAKELTFQ